MSVYEKQEHIDTLIKEVEVYKDLIKLKDTQISKMKQDLENRRETLDDNNMGNPIFQRFEDEVSVSEDNNIFIQAMFNTDDYSEGGNEGNYNNVERINDDEDLTVTEENNDTIPTTNQDEPTGQ